MAVAVTYAGAALELLRSLLARDRVALFLTATFVLYYLVAPGPITMPRYPPPCPAATLSHGGLNSPAYQEGSMDDPSIPEDLSIMRQAVNYRQSLFELVQPYLRGDVLEIGAGLATLRNSHWPLRPRGLVPTLPSNPTLAAERSSPKSSSLQPCRPASWRGHSPKRFPTVRRTT